MTRQLLLRRGLLVVAAVAFRRPDAASAQAAPSAYTTGIRYDVDGRLLAKILPDPDGAGSLHFRATRNTYDGRGRLVRAEEGELASWQSDAVAPGSWSGFTIQKTADLVYDSNDHLLTQTISAGGVAQTLTQYSYDAVGRLECTATRMNKSQYASLPASACTPQTTGSEGPDQITKNVYDAADEVVQVRKGIGGSAEKADATYSYTGNGKREYVIDGVGNRARFVYDGHDRLQQWIFPSPAKPSGFDDSSPANALTTAGSVNAADYELYEYDANGNRTVLQKRDGRRIRYSYDARNRVASKCATAGATCVVPNASTGRDVYYSYDLVGRQLIARFDSSAGTEGLTNTYDGFGNLTSSSITMGAGAVALTKSVSTPAQPSIYDADNNRTQMTVDGQTFTYVFDGLDRLNGVYEGAGTATPLDQFSYNADGTVHNRTEGGGSSASYSYDSIGRLNGQSDAFPSAPASNVSWTFGSNPANQLSSEQRDNDSYAFGGLVVVNRNYSTNGLDQYNSAGAASFQYDANGNLTSDGANTYSYDAENRMVGASSSTGTTTLVYDPLGRLFQVVRGSANTRFLYDGDALVAEYDSSGALTNRYAHASDAVADDPLAWYVGSGTATKRYLHPDHEGSIIAVTNTSGAPSINRYDEYGIPQTDAGGANANSGRFQYTGQAFIPELGAGMYYYKARMYSATLGRFLQTDPVGYKDQINLYAYVGNDPIDGSDPTGTETWAQWWKRQKQEFAEAQRRDQEKYGDGYGNHDTPKQRQARMEQLQSIVLSAGPGGMSKEARAAANAAASSFKEVAAKANTTLAGVGEMVGWGSGRNAAAEAASRAREVDSAAVQGMRDAGLTKELALAAREVYRTAVATGKKGGEIAVERYKLMVKVLQEW